MNKELIERILKVYDKDLGQRPLSDILYKHYAETYESEFTTIENLLKTFDEDSGLNTKTKGFYKYYARIYKEGFQNEILNKQYIESFCDLKIGMCRRKDNSICIECHYFHNPDSRVK
jgi:hypothetical protein